MHCRSEREKEHLEENFSTRNMMHSAQQEISTKIFAVFAVFPCLGIIRVNSYFLLSLQEPKKAIGCHYITIHGPDPDLGDQNNKVTIIQMICSH